MAEGAEPRRFRNRNEREFAGYRDAIDEISRATDLDALSVPYVLHLHRLLFGHTDGGGGRLKTEQNLIVSYQRGHREVLFTPPSPRETEILLPDLFDRYRLAVADQAAHPVLLIGALVLDFLAASYDDFEARVVARRNLAAGSKQDQVRRYILDHAPAVFRFRDIRSALPGISDPTIKRVLADLRRDGAIELVDDRASGRLSAWRRRTQGSEQ